MLLEEEALKQFAEDGVNREQAFCYHKFSLEFLVAALLCGRRNGDEFSSKFNARIEAAIEFLVACIDVGGNIPAYGDSDDGRVFSLGCGEEFSPYLSMAAVGAQLFNRPDFRINGNTVDEQCAWLFSAQERALAVLDRKMTVLSVPRNFSRGGYVILGRDIQGPREIRILFDVGKLGYNRIAGHGHADGLSLLLSYYGQEFLVDSGTYCYNAAPDLRHYFRGTSAHNTLTVDGKDQSVYGGSFLWLQDVATTVEALDLGENRDRIVASHDGYRRLRDPVRHRRVVELDKRQAVLHVYDSIECAESHDVALFWHLAPECAVTLEGNHFKVSRGPLSLVMDINSESSTVELLAATEQTPEAWVSRKFYQREASQTIVVRAHLAPGMQIETKMRFAELANDAT
jgi:hypothetical protein